MRAPDREFSRHVQVYPGEAHTLNFIPARALHILEAVKTRSSTSTKIPLQGMYSRIINNEYQRWRFKPFQPFDLVDDVMAEAPMRWFDIERSRIRAVEHGYAVAFRNDALLPSLPKRPFRSRALLYEDSVLLPWIVSAPDMVAERPGSFIHAGAFIRFTASDGSDPRENGRTYKIGFPQPADGIEPYRDDPLYSRTTATVPV